VAIIKKRWWPVNVRPKSCHFITQTTTKVKAHQQLNPFSIQVEERHRRRTVSVFRPIKKSQPRFRRRQANRRRRQCSGNRAAERLLRRLTHSLRSSPAADKGFRIEKKYKFGNCYKFLNCTYERLTIYGKKQFFLIN
jgi:hypothetical protein